MRPSSVSLPVATTTPVARPDTTMVPENDMHSRSPTVALAETASVFLSAGTDSPVSAASSVRKFFASTRRRSAGILSPHSTTPTCSRLEKHNVPGNELFCRNHARLAAAQGAGLCGQHVADRLQCLLGLALLNEAEQRVEDDHAKDDRRIDPQVEHQLDEAGTEEDIDEDIVELRQEPHERPPFLALRQAVGAVLLQPARGFARI